MRRPGRPRCIDAWHTCPVKPTCGHHSPARRRSLTPAWMTRAELLILDEPTSGLDPLMERTFRECMHAAKDNGQTVFLSSHILSEVEALCDRVAILRAGELLEIGTLAEMRHLSAVRVRASFDGPAV